MKQVDKPKKPIIFYYLVALTVLVLLNTFLFPSLLKQKVKEVDYGTFLTMLKEKKVSVAEVEQDYIYFTDNSEENNVYCTATFADDSLVDRLLDSGCKFGEIKQKEMNPILGFLLAYILPIVIFIGIGQLLSRSMMKKMGAGMGNTMSFGKSNAKI
ncbi:MAG: ATP-dependent metallopeptidase FtsH/Yme1/Tma family protein, partial [Lachnospiraceae bacterium]|nr:ATP-dependent metallopeptidase FtsH/Yme1/Tma family protein [Lachnospiraceae bacterium]